MKTVNPSKGTGVNAEVREQQILRRIAIGGLTPPQLATLETELAEIRSHEAARRRRLELSTAPHQPRWKHADPY